MNQNQKKQNLSEGKVIIAEPFMKDTFFKKSVVLIADYHKTGTVGFILNQPLKMNVKRLISDFPKSAAQVCYGGPVANETIHYLHTAGVVVDGAKEILPGLFWGGDFAKLKLLISKGVISDRQIRFYVGYSGWSPGQLEAEMTESQAWIIANGHKNYVFNELGSEELWQHVMKHKGSNFEILADGAKQVNLN